MTNERTRVRVPPEALLSFALLAVLLLSGLLYYRAVKVQRFLEPALAMTKPRGDFVSGIQRAFTKEFGTWRIPGVQLTTGSIFVDEATLLASAHHQIEVGPLLLEKMAKVLHHVLNDPRLDRTIELIMIIAGAPVESARALTQQERRSLQTKADFILDALLRADPSLSSGHGHRFVTAAIARHRSAARKTGWVEFRFISAYHVHVRVLQQLQEYVH